MGAPSWVRQDKVPSGLASLAEMCTGSAAAPRGRTSCPVCGRSFAAAMTVEPKLRKRFPDHPAKGVPMAPRPAVVEHDQPALF